MSERDFGQQLRQLRHDRGETLEDVSTATGLSVAMLSRVERGERLPSPESVEALAAHFGLSADDLMSETIAHRMLNRYGRASSMQAAERMWEAGGAPAYQRVDVGATAASAPTPEASAALQASAPDMLVALRARSAPAGDAPRPQAPTPRLPMREAGASFSVRPIEELFGEEPVDSSALDSLSDAAHVAEVALDSAMRAIRRAMASGDPVQIDEAEQVLHRLRLAIERLR